MRILLNLLRTRNKIKLVVITGIIQTIKVAAKVAPIIYKIVKKTKVGNSYIYRHPRIAKYGTAVAGTAPLIYDLLNIDYSAIQKTPSRGKFPQTRKYMEQYRSKRERYCENYTRKRYSSSRRY